MTEMHSSSGSVGTRPKATTLGAMKSTTVKNENPNDTESKAKTTGGKEYVEFAVTDMQGWRVEMEDSHFHVLNWDKCRKTGKGYHLFGVFDGHGGSTTAQVVARVLPKRIKDCKEYKQWVEQGQNEEHKDLKLLEHAFQSEFLRLDQEMSGFEAAGSGSLSSGKGSDPLLIRDQSGCTAIVALVAPNFIMFINAGDSRAIVVNSGKVQFGTKDHKPTDEIEERRILNAGGKVQNGRVDADLAVSRAFGDFSFKTNRNVTWKEQKVSVFPDCTFIPRTELTEYLVLCCDGIWDVMSNEDCNQFVRNTLLDGEHTLSNVVEDLVQQCLLDDSKDNMTAMLVMLSGGCKYFTKEANLNRDRPRWENEEDTMEEHR